MNCILDKMIEIIVNVVKLLNLVLKMIILKTSKTRKIINIPYKFLIDKAFLYKKYIINMTFLDI